MKDIKRDLNDSLRPEYTRSDFGEIVQGKYVTAQIDLSELLRLLLACISEDENLTITCQCTGSHVAAHKRGDWTYEFDNANQVTLRFWLNEFENLDEPVAIPACVSASQEKVALKGLLSERVRNLKRRANGLR